MKRIKKLLDRNEILLTLAQYGNVTQSQIICMLRYIEENQPDMIVQEEAISGCTQLEELMASEIPVIVFRPILTSDALIEKINNTSGGPFKKIILICKIETMGILGGEFQKNEVEGVKDGAILKLNFKTNSKKIKKEKILMQSAVE